MNPLRIINLKVVSDLTGLSYYKLTRWFSGDNKALKSEEKKQAKDAVNKTVKQFIKKLEE